MKIGLFAAKDVGYRTAKFLGDTGNHPECLVLDSSESEEDSERIIDASGVFEENVFYSDTLYKKKNLRALKELEVDLIVLAWWPCIIPKELIDIPRLGCLNTHYSCLPYHRGKNGNFWTFVDGAPFGATIHFVDEGVDSGDIAFQKVIEKTWLDTGETLYKKVQDELVKLFIDKFEAIKAGNIPRNKQREGSYHHSRELEPASEIQLQKKYTGEELLNLIRARTFPPHPAAWFVDSGVKYEVRIQITRAE